MVIQVIRKEEAKTSIWSGGMTNEYFIYPLNSKYANRDFLFRISSAIIKEIPSEFTKFDGFRRYLTMLEGNLELSINEQKQQYAEHELFSFLSTDNILSYSAGKDFNLMLNNSISDEVVKIANETFNCSSSFCFLFAIKNIQIKINSKIVDLDTYDCLVIENKTLEAIVVDIQDSIIVGYW